MRTLTICAAAVLLSAPQIAAAADAPCLTAKEATAVAAYAMPSVIAGTTQRCGAVLGKDSWISKNGTGLSKRYAERKAAVWPEAKAALLKMTGGAAGSGDVVLDTLKSMPDETVQQIADSMVTAAVAERVPANRCFVVDRFLSLIAPLPPESTAELVALTLGVVSQGEKPKIGKLALCKA